MNIESVWEMILACEWQRIWWGISHAHWANVWASISAIFTAAAVGVAGLALLRWRKQDELKAKFAFKKAIGDYAYQLIQLPPTLFTQDIQKNAEKCQKLTDLLAACNYAWFMTEGIITNKKVIQYWELLIGNHQKYLAGKMTSEDLGAACMGILNEKFVFK